MEPRFTIRLLIYLPHMHRVKRFSEWIEVKLRAWLRAQGILGNSIKGELHDSQRSLFERVAEARGKLQAFLQNVTALRANLPALPVCVLPSVDDVVTEAEAAFEPLKRERDDAVMAERSYRSEHGLDGLPETPTKLASLIKLICALVIESLINASFFVRADLAAGLSSALALSTTISAVNVGLSALAGFTVGRNLAFGLTSKTPNDPGYRRKRFIARVGLSAFLITMSGFHATVALLRAQEDIYRVSHSISSYRDALTNPESLFLWLTCIALSALSWREGKRGFDDPYPGYGDKRRAVEAAHMELDDTHADYAELIEERFSAAKNAYLEAFRPCKKAYASFNTAVFKCLQSDAQFRSAVARAEGQMAQRIAEVTDLLTSTGQPPGVSADVAALSDLSGELNYELPSYLSPPSPSETLSSLERAKEHALSRLAALL